MVLTCLSQHKLSNFLLADLQLEFAPIPFALEMRSEALPEIPSQENFSLKLFMPLFLRIGLVTVDDSPFLDSLITLCYLEEGSGFECSLLVTLGAMLGFARQDSTRSRMFSPFKLLPEPCPLN